MTEITLQTGKTGAARYRLAVEESSDRSRRRTEKGGEG